MDEDRDTAPSLPRWVKAWTIVAVVLTALFAAWHMTGTGFGGGH